MTHVPDFPLPSCDRCSQASLTCIHCRDALVEQRDAAMAALEAMADQYLLGRTASGSCLGAVQATTIVLTELKPGVWGNTEFGPFRRDP